MFDKEKIDWIIKHNWNLKTAQIAELLNQANLTTEHNRDWTQPQVSKYANKFLSLRKKAEHTRDHSKEENIVGVLVGEIVAEEKEEKKEIPLNTEQRLALIETAIFEKDGQFFTDSLAVAKIFDKKHSDVLGSIRDLECSENFRTREFSLVSYNNSQNKIQPKFNLTKKGFSFIALGFTGSKAVQFKEAYIERFEELEKQAQQPKQQLITDPLAIMAMSIEVLRKTNEEVNKLKSDFIQTKNEFKNEIYQVSEKIINFEQRSKQAEEDLNSVPESDVLPLQRDVRMNINDAIEKYSKAFLCIPKHAWGFNYKDFERRYHMNLDARTKAAGLKHKLDYIESIGKLPELYAIILENLRNKKVGS